MPGGAQSGARSPLCPSSPRLLCQAKALADAAAEAAGVQLVSSATNTPPYTFMGYNPKSVAMLRCADPAHSPYTPAPLSPRRSSNSFGRGTRHFPAHLTRNAGLDKDVVDLMRPLFNAGLRPERFARTLLEMHTKEHGHASLAHEHEIAARRADGDTSSASPLSGFADRSCWAGCVPQGSYLAAVYKSVSADLAPHFDKEVKKRGARRLSWDVSYKEAKHLAQYHGHALYKGLLTATNEVGEVRLQFQVVTDAHDQMERPLLAMVQTLNALNQPQTELIFTDKPSEDREFFLRLMPSLRESQRRLQQSSGAGWAPATPDFARADASQYGTVIKSAQTINSAISALRNQIDALPEPQRVVSLDAEWDVEKHAYTGQVFKQGKIALIQVGYDLQVRGTALQYVYRFARPFSNLLSSL